MEYKKIKDYEKEFELLKEKVKANSDSISEQDFYNLENKIDRDFHLLLDIVFKHPKYNFKPTAEVPESLELEKLKVLSDKIERYLKKKDKDSYNVSDELDSMFPNRYDEGFDEDSMSYDSVFGDD